MGEKLGFEVFSDDWTVSMFSVTRLQWLIKRLRSMEPTEVASRLLDVGRHGAVYSVCWRMPQRARQRQSDLSGNIAIPRADRHPWHTCPESHLNMVAQADDWVQLRARFFGLAGVSLSNPIDWHRDYSSDNRGPQKYSGMIDHRDVTAVGDIKYIWELNRLHHLVSLAVAYTSTGKTAYWESLEQQSRSWIEQNPFMIGVNWKSPLEAGIRLISWALVAWLTADDAKCRDFFRHELSETIYAHQYFIRTFYAKHSSANNHFIGEMAGLYIGSVCWPWFRESSAWWTFAHQQLVQAISDQVEDDGVGKELATEYQLFILEFFLLAGALGQVVDDPFPSLYWKRMQDMAAFLEALSDCEGNLPMFGDGDSGQVISEYVSVAQRTRLLRAILRPSPAHPTGAVLADSRAHLLLWGKAPESLPIQQTPEPPASSYPRGGYYVLAANRGSDREMVVAFDAGRLGLSPLYAHGHADALSFWLSYRGQVFFIDPGTFTYYADEAWRSYFRSTAAHNTVRVDGEDQSMAGGRFLWRQAASAQGQREVSQSALCVEGVHDGYQRLADPVMHRRSIRMSETALEVRILDRLECQDNHEVELFFHFHDQCDVRQIHATSFEAVQGEARIEIHLSAVFQCQLYHGSQRPIAGWVSDQFGVKTPAFTLRAQAQIMGTTEFTTTIMANAPDMQAGGVD